MMNTIIPNQQEVELHQDTKKNLYLYKKPDWNDERIKRNYRHLAEKKQSTQFLRVLHDL